MKMPLKNKKTLFVLGLSLVLALIFGLFVFSGGGAMAQVSGAAASEEREALPLLWYLAPLGAVIGLIAALVFYRLMKRAPQGNEKMEEIALGVRQGAYAYLKRQYLVVVIFLVVLSGILAFLAFGLPIPTMSPWTPFAFLTGGFFSGLCGWLGMKTATYANSRTAQAARLSLDSALKVAFRSGAVMGLVVVGFGLLDICLWFLVLRAFTDYSLTNITVTMLTFGMGASTQALFARVGGGIFTKAADVGSDLVGKVEAGIPEDDPRNAAVLADNVGDNVGDVAGMGADLYESYCATILATMALGVASGLGIYGVMVPMLVAACGVIAAVVGILMVRTREGASTAQLLSSLGRGINISAVLIALASGALVVYLLGIKADIGIMPAVRIWLSMVTGLAVGIAIGKWTEYSTDYNYGPTKEIARQSLTGPATVVLAGFSAGQLSTWFPVVVVVIGIMLSYWLAGGATSPVQGLYGISLASVGMLSTLGITLATDAYGPIADNAAGNATMSGLEPVVRERTDKLDSIGNTTAATGKGFAIGSAALTALAMIAAYLEEIKAALFRLAEHSANGLAEVVPGVFWTAEQIAKATLNDFINVYGVYLMNPKVIIGIFVGSMLVFVVAALINKAIGRTAGRVVEEVRRQWHEIPGLMEGKARPDYGRCVWIAISAAQREMVWPTMLAIVVPIFVGVVFGPGAVLGLLMGGLSTGFILAITLANSGGAWDNAKKLIESGEYGGKGSEAHKAGVVGDTVGDPFKDASGPSLNILIKLMCWVSIVFAGVATGFSLFFARLIGF